MRFRHRIKQPGNDEPRGSLSGDSTLVLAARIDRGAFGALYERHLDGILNYCYYRLGDWDEAADTAQQVFANALAKLDSFEDRGDSFRAWLFRIAHNEASEHLRRRVRRAEEPLPEFDEPLDPAPAPEDLAAIDDDHRRLRAMLGQLTPTCRRVIELRLAELTDQQIALTLGMTHGAVRAAQSRGLDQLQALYRCEATGPGGRHG